VNDKEFNVPMYWVRPARTLSAAPGMHRFVWDLTYPPPDVLSRDYPISAIYHDTPLYPLGATVLPGKYTVRMTVNTPGGSGPGVIGVGAKYAAPLEIRMDPRVKALPEDLQRQFDLDRKIADALHRDLVAIQQVRQLREQLKALTERKSAPEIAKLISGLESEAAALEGDEGSYGARFLSTPDGRSLARLNTGFSAVLSAFDGSDATPTTQQSAMFGELEKALTERLAAWEQMKTKNVAELNARLKQAGLPALDLTNIQGRTPAAAQITSQDKDRDVE
jgi:hypothetical protein